MQQCLVLNAGVHQQKRRQKRRNNCRALQKRYELYCKEGISVRIAKALASLTALEIEMLRYSKLISLQTKLSMLKTGIFGSMQYACETWVLTMTKESRELLNVFIGPKCMKESERRILTFERKCYRKIMLTEWSQNEELSTEKTATV